MFERGEGAEYARPALWLRTGGCGRRWEGEGARLLAGEGCREVCRLLADPGRLGNLLEAGGPYESNLQPRLHVLRLSNPLTKVKTP